MTRLLAILCFLPGLALANSYRESIDDAAESVEDASNALRRANPSCKVIVPSLSRAVDDIDSIRRGTTEHRMSEVQSFVNSLQTMSAQAGCPPKVVERISRAMAALNTAHSLLDATDDRRDRKHHHRDDDDDDAAPPPPPGRSIEAALGELRVVYGERVNGEPGVRVDVPSASLRGIGRTPFYFGGRLRAQGGEWSEWVTSPQYTAPQDPYVWNNVYSQFFPARLLRSATGARLVARLSIFDANRNELAFKETVIDLVGGPSAPPLPPPPVVARDCGTGDDSGCTMQREGRWPMDRDTFNGFLGSLRATPSDLVRAEMCKAVLANNFLTAKQLGMVLELFNSDLIRLDAAKLAARHTVDPLHALGLTSKFRSSMLQADFARLMSEQR